MLSRKALNALLQYSEHGIFWRGLVSFVGFKQIAVNYIPEKRLYGKTKYTLKKMLRLALDGITSFSIKPLHITTIFGVLCSIGAFIYAIYALIIKLFTNQTIEGWTSILISILFIGGIQLISLGILGEYLGKIFIETKNRPHYIIDEES